MILCPNRSYMTSRAQDHGTDTLGGVSVIVRFIVKFGYEAYAIAPAEAAVCAKGTRSASVMTHVPAAAGRWRASLAGSFRSAGR